MPILLLTAIVLLGSLGATLARADEFAGQQTSDVNAALDRQATDAQLSDPTAPGSLRSHGHP